MIASFDTSPSCKKYIPTNDEEDEDGGVTRGMNNLNKTMGISDDWKWQGQFGCTKFNQQSIQSTKTSSITLSPESNSFTSFDGTNTPHQYQHYASSNQVVHD